MSPLHDRPVIAQCGARGGSGKRIEISVSDNRLNVFQCGLGGGGEERLPAERPIVVQFGGRESGRERIKMVLPDDRPFVVQHGGREGCG